MCTATKTLCTFFVCNPHPNGPLRNRVWVSLLRPGISYNGLFSPQFAERYEISIKLVSFTAVSRVLVWQSFETAVSFSRDTQRCEELVTDWSVVAGSPVTVFYCWSEGRSVENWCQDIRLIGRDECAKRSASLRTVGSRFNSNLHLME